MEVARFSAGHDQPIYVTLVHLWTRLVRPSEWTLRLPSALPGGAVHSPARSSWARACGDRSGLVGGGFSSLWPPCTCRTPRKPAPTPSPSSWWSSRGSACLLGWETERSRWAWVVYGGLAATVPAIHLLADGRARAPGRLASGTPGSSRRLWIYAARLGHSPPRPPHAPGLSPVGGDRAPGQRRGLPAPAARASGMGPAHDRAAPPVGPRGLDHPPHRPRVPGLRPPRARCALALGAPAARRGRSR